MRITLPRYQAICLRIGPRLAIPPVVERVSTGTSNGSSYEKGVHGDAFYSILVELNPGGYFHCSIEGRDISIERGQG
jgi:hypothetical protein